MSVLSSPHPGEPNWHSLLGDEGVRTPASGDTVAGQQPHLVLEPAGEIQLAAALREANRAGLAVIPRGGGTKLSWGHPPERADVILSTRRLDKVIEHPWADLTVSVEAGVTIASLQAALAVHNQRLAIDVLWPKSATVGGILSANDSGALRLRFGSLRDLIIGVTIALPDGTLASGGGKVVKNVAGYDLPKLVTGAFGTLGVITRAVFRLHPQPRESRTFTCLAKDPADAQRLLLAIQDAKLAHTALQARFVEGVQPQIDVLFEGTEAGLAAQAAQLKSLIAPAPISGTEPPVWKARQELYAAARRQDAPCAIAKISLLPTSVAQTTGAIAALARALQLRAHTVMQATGLGCTLLEGAPQHIHSALQALRSQLEAASGSLFLADHPADLPPFDPWGTPPGSLSLMRALRQRFDPARTLNPGRFLV